MSFNPDYYFGIDLARAARDQYGPDAKVVRTGDHAYNWQVQLNGKIYGLEMELAVDRQYSIAHRSVLVGPEFRDWKAANLKAAKKKVIPIVLSNTEIWNTAEIQRKIDNFKTHILVAQEWLRLAAGKTFDVLPPLLLGTKLTAQDLADGNAAMTQGQTYFWRYHDEVKRLLGADWNPEEHIYLVGFTNYNAGSVAAKPMALVASEVFDNSTEPFEVIQHRMRGDEADNIYAITHELLHVLGLGHAEEVYPGNPDARFSVTQAARPTDMRLLPEDKVKLENHPFLVVE